MHRVLLAEDNKLNQIVAVGTLRKLGYEVDVVDGGVDAIAAFHDRPYDAILLDVMMPDLDGYQAAAAIREQETEARIPRTPIIGISARAMPVDRQIALDAGFNDYLTKPLREQELRDALQRWIGAPVILR